VGSLHLPSRRARLRLIGAAVVVAVGVLGFTTSRAVKPGGHVTECGVDAKGPYAKVRVTSRGAMDHEGVGVDFSYDGHWYASGGSRIEVPTSGSTTAFVRGSWPPRVINVDHDGGPKGEIPVPGRVAGGHWTHFDTVTRVDPPGLRLTPHFKALVEPDDKSLIGCKVFAPTNGWQ
jgi:hypothetical protein